MEYPTNKFVQSLIDITSQSEKKLLEHCFTKSLYQLLPINKVVLYQIYYNADKVDCYRTLELQNDHTIIENLDQSLEIINHSSIPDFDNCLKYKTFFTNKTENGLITLYPITDKLGRVNSVFAMEQPTNSSPFDKVFLNGFFQIYQNYLNLLNESERDTLTNLLNRRTFDRDLKKMLSISSNNHHKESSVEHPHRRDHKQEDTHWLAIADIDFFKQVNDDFGHLYGDEVLLLLANIMRQSFRDTDKLFRFGGEEFVIILRAMDLQSAHKALERFRYNVEKYTFPQVGSVTISIGYVEINQLAIPTEILGHADQALYYAKNNGRNQLHQYEQLIADGRLITNETPLSKVEFF